MASTPLGERLEELLSAGGWSQRQLARECGLTESHVGRAISGGTINSDTAIAIHERTGVDLNWLLLGQGQLNRSSLTYDLTHRMEAAAARRIAERTARREPSPKSGHVASTHTNRGTKRGK